MVDAPVEGGSWDAIANTWTLNRYRVMERRWEQHGPPIKVMIAAYFKLIKKRRPPSARTAPSGGEERDDLDSRGLPPKPEPPAEYMRDPNLRPPADDEQRVGTMKEFMADFLAAGGTKR